MVEGELALEHLGHRTPLRIGRVGPALGLRGTVETGEMGHADGAVARVAVGCAVRPELGQVVRGQVDAGLFQQVAVTPGLGYKFNILWAVERINAQAWQEGFEAFSYSRCNWMVLSSIF